MSTNYHSNSNYSYYYGDPRYVDARNVADCLVNAFKDDPKFEELLGRNKILKEWVQSLEKAKLAQQRAKEARARAKQKQEEENKKFEAALSKLTDEEKALFGLDTSKKSKREMRKV